MTDLVTASTIGFEPKFKNRRQFDLNHVEGNSSNPAVFGNANPTNFRNENAT